MKKSKILVILGPTASGKSELAVRMAKKLNGEVISADSRQVYKGLDIGTGKITKKEMRGVPHHLLDVARPQKQFTVSEYKKLTDRAIADILKRDKFPIICGGTGFYIQAIVDNLVLPEVPLNQKLRNKLKQKSVSQLFIILKKLDPKRAETIDRNNPRRLVRAIEIASTLGKVPPLRTQQLNLSIYDTTLIGIKIPDEELKRRIRKRLKKRLKQGMINETRKLHGNGLSWKRMDELGLEYRYVAQYLQNTISKKEMAEKLEIAIWQYAKRQMTWFKRDKRIKWIARPTKIVGTLQKYSRTK